VSVLDTGVATARATDRADELTAVRPVRPPRHRRSRGVLLLLAVIVAVQGVAIAGAMRHTSVTFDEIVFLATGARGWQTGQFDLVTDHPPLAQYVYGLPVYLTRPAYPDESGVDDAERERAGYRYRYAQRLLFGVGNDPERLTFLGRLPAVAFALLLTVAVFGVLRRRHGDGAALLGGVLVAFLPDVLAHGGVAYNDLPTAALIFVSVYAMDSTLRKPTARRGIVAGVAVALALGMKMSALVLGPIAALLLGVELLRRGTDVDRLRVVSAAVGCAVIAAYVTMVVVYTGDFALAELRAAAASKLDHAAVGHAAPSLLLGETRSGGFWYFYPVAFFLKTPAGLHLLAVLAVLGFAGGAGMRRHNVLGSQLRAPIIAIAVLLVVLMTARLNIGFRHALPMLPFICVLIAVGVTRLWHASTRLVRGVIAAAAGWTAIFALSWYPHYLPFVSEYGPGRDLGHTVYVDSNLDWGQGLLELRRYMRANGIERVYLSYFGSALPAGYGIDHLPLASYFPLPVVDRTEGEAEPTVLVVSATNLHGGYLLNDPFGPLRDVQPDAVLGHTMFVYHMTERAP
jgi:4-amino-4-deoxy-L-arabinose transferase-like glycosyltransferase